MHLRYACLLFFFFLIPSILHLNYDLLLLSPTTGELNARTILHLQALTGEKRHRLVKGCGNAQNTQNGNKEHEEVKPDVDDSQIKSERA